ncbi:MAG TPA: xanthine dehydrogenase family protein molybdopterin-binding subunit [Beijerinckia sp.]|jgi:isoquinoline 1-oxidoreductase beta subunit|nr:xanthine dehydrogenase family protein molybdopterin-binding subunit [Beijerinckia sp.]
MFRKSIFAQKRAEAVRPSRRQFLLATASVAGSLVVATRVELSGLAKAATEQMAPMPNAFVKIAPDNTVTILIKHLDKGQGVTTGLATLVADELDADWAQVRTEFAPANAAIYANLFFKIQGTGGSTSIANSWDQLRNAGAAARAMLVAAAADTWKVPAKEITIEKGVLVHKASRKHATFGEFASKAAALPVPDSVTPKDPKDWIYIGKKVPRIDSVAKTTGAAIYALDIKRPGMLTAVLARPKLFGGTVKSFDPSDALKVKGVVEVVQVPQGVAVLATDTWSAIKGREALKVEWDDSKAETRSTDEIFADYRKLAAQSGKPAARRGDTDAAFKEAAKIIEAEFLFPYLAHAPMEPLNATIELKPDGGAEIWAGSQFQTVEQAVAAAVLGTKPENIAIHTVWAGASFGRRATPNADYIAEAAAIAKASSHKVPIHLVWTREDDLTGGRYRPATLHRVRIALDAKGDLSGWGHHIVNQSFVIGTPLEPMIVKEGIDETAVEGAADTPYALPNLAVDWHQADSPITTLWWRSVGHSHSAQVMEVMMDEAARAAGKDPLAFRLALLKDEPRVGGVLQLAAEKSGYGEKLPAGQGRGIAVHKSFNTYVAMVADVSVANGSVKVDRIVAAVDCGIPVNPDVIWAQMEGGAGYALGAALRDKITFDKGRVEQSNFDGYQPLRITDMPKIEVHIVPSTEPPTGVGEPGVPPLAPAVTNAIYAATGKRLHSLPWDFEVLKGA